MKKITIRYKVYNRKEGESNKAPVEFIEIMSILNNSEETETEEVKEK